jgi:hypothetical protein
MDGWMQRMEMGGGAVSGAPSRGLAGGVAACVTAKSATRAPPGRSVWRWPRRRQCGLGFLPAALFPARASGPEPRPRMAYSLMSLSIDSGYFAYLRLLVLNLQRQRYCVFVPSIQLMMHQFQNRLSLWNTLILHCSSCLFYAVIGDFVFSFGAITQ